ncbi:uncharacterized protein LY89DRAFT_84454 [Mollisia scopiformis]|uniref:Uncharacterized protein n=1 Tax=Mollisia scopiformis TaxID=149040 RepID=A0A194X8P4_MOLSC|nr:uncharacterized protein LY89DRAFT_84454 [Mollisia scopiformis]KUJ16484.1 hypothetical protein LY89DRAFT_84454 [Mollisia scopiformis]
MLFSKLILSGLMAAGLSFAAPAGDANLAVREAQMPTGSFTFTHTGTHTRGPRPTGSFTRGPRPTGTGGVRGTGTHSHHAHPTGSFTGSFSFPSPTESIVSPPMETTTE